MREIRTSGLMSGDGRRGFATAPTLDSTHAQYPVSGSLQRATNDRHWRGAAGELTTGRGQGRVLDGCRASEVADGSARR
jgi:hypothetical protein